MTKEAFRQLALSFDGTESCKHFVRTGFRVTGRRMFATYLEEGHSANIFLRPEEQKIFCEMSDGIFPVANKWGEKGATTFQLDKVPEGIVFEGLLSAYNDIVKK